VQPAALVARLLGRRATVTVDRVGHVFHDPTQFVRRCLTRIVDQRGLDLTDPHRPLRRERPRDRGGVPRRDLPVGERGGDLGQILELAGQLEMPARDALRHVARVAQRRGRVHEALGLPVVRPVICGDFFQPRSFRRVELLTELCDGFE